MSPLLNKKKHPSPAAKGWAIAGQYLRKKEQLWARKANDQLSALSIRQQAAVVMLLCILLATCSGYILCSALRAHTLPSPAPIHFPIRLHHQTSPTNH